MPQTQSLRLSPSASTHLLRRLSAHPAALLFILFLAAAVRFCYLIELQNNPLPGFVAARDAFDQFRYMEIAKEFIAGNWKGSELTVYSAAYSYLIAALYVVFPQSLNTIFVLQILTGILAVFVIYKSALLLFEDARIGLLAAFMMALYSPLIFYECVMLRASLVAYLNLFAFFFLLRAFVKNHRLSFLLGGLMTGLSYTFRPHALLVFILPYLLFTRRLSLKTKAIAISLFLAGCILSAAPLEIRNASFGKQAMSPTLLTDAFWIGNTYNSTGLGFDNIATRHALNHETEGKFGKTLKVFTREIAKYPHIYKNLYARKIKMYFNSYEIPSNLSFDMFRNESRSLKAAFFGFSIVSPLALLGFLLMFRRYPWVPLLYGFVIVLSLSVILFSIQGRYRIPGIPLFILSSAYAFRWLVSSLSSKRFLPPATCVLALAILVWITRPDTALIQNRFGSQVRALDYGNMASAYFARAQEESSGEGKKKLLKKASVNVNNALQIMPNNPSYLEGAGLIAYGLEDHAAALAVMKRLLQLDPGNQTAQKIISVLTP